MLEKLQPKEITKRTKTLLKDHLPLAATIVTLGVASAEQDARLGAITTAAYLGYDKTKDKFRDVLQKRKKDHLTKILPEEIKQEIKETSADTLLSDEYTYFVKDSALMDSVLPITISPYEENMLSVVTPKPDEAENDEGFDHDDEQYMDNEKENYHYIGIQMEDIPDFVTGALAAHYILRKTDRSPQFSPDLINTYNVSLAEEANDSENSFFQFMTNQEKKVNETLLKQSHLLLHYTETDNQMAKNGAAYVLGLYERQKNAEELASHFYHEDPPPSV